MHDVLELDAVGQAQAVRAGQLSAAELIEATIDRIRTLDAKYSFVASDCFDAGRGAAKALAASGPLSGAGLLVKDLIPFPGMKLEFGSRLFAGQVSEEATPYSKALLAAGLVGLGRTTTSELGLLGSTESRLNGATHNPWAPDRSAGGSSGGAAAAVACRAVPLAHASDGGGSIRIPASFNGVFGLKPSRGRTWRSAAFDSPITPLLSDHCVSISVRDSAAFMAVTEQTGPDAPLPPTGFVTASKLHRLRIGVYTTTLTGVDVAPEVADAVAHTVGVLESLGHEVRPVAPPAVEGHRISDAFFSLAGLTITGLETMIGTALNDEVVEPFTLALRDWYPTTGPDVMKKTSVTLADATAAMQATAEGHDVLLCPTTPIPPPLLGYLGPDLPWDTTIDRMRTLAGFTSIHNMAGFPGMSVPLYWTEAGLPVGSHFTAPIGQEDLLLRLAYQLEAACPWRHRRPQHDAIAPRSPTRPTLETAP